MKSTTLKERLGLDEDMELVEAEGANTEGMSDEELKVESLKIATNIGKLMSNVTTEDIVSIAETVAKFIKGGADASLETSTSSVESEPDEEATADTEEDFTTEEPEEGEEAENESTESEEDFEI